MQMIYKVGATKLKYQTVKSMHQYYQSHIVIYRIFMYISVTGGQFNAEWVLLLKQDFECRTFICSVVVSHCCIGTLLSKGSK